MYNTIKEIEEPMEENELVQEVDEITMDPCPCTKEGTSLEVYVQFSSVTFHWKHKQLEYWGDYGGLIKIKYCPFCGRKL